MANNCREGIEAAVEQRPELIVVDSHLPHGEGLWLVAKLRRSGGCFKTPIIVVGTDEGAAEEERFSRIGADTYLTKPLDIARFDRIVLGLLEVASLR